MKKRRIVATVLLTLGLLGGMEASCAEESVTLAGVPEDSGEFYESESEPVKGDSFSAESEIAWEDSSLTVTVSAGEDSSAIVKDMDSDELMTNYYNEILQKYLTAIESGWETDAYDDNGLCYLAGYLSSADDIGYYLVDIDEDGAAELLIGETADEDDEESYVYPGMFYDLYTVKDGILSQVVTSAERSRYYLCTDKVIAYDGSSSAFCSANAWYSLNGTELKLEEAVLYDDSYDSENPYFYSTTEVWEDYSTPISQSEAAELYAVHEYMTIPFTTLSEAAEELGLSAYDSSASDGTAAAGTDSATVSSEDSASGSFGSDGDASETQTTSALRQQAAEEVAAAAAQAEEIAYKLDNEILTQSELNQYSCEMYQIWDDILNVLWGYLKMSLSEEEMTALTQEELAWIEEKESAVAEAGAEFEGGTMQPYLENTTAASITKERVYVLLEMIP
ncbi:MAG: DUF1311 domain-containing protein [Lachnospiraceae bacterium]|nr:DUF1311 domain-containing protein [Lachnospiraceae bacterium]